MTERAAPFYCPYCGEEDLRPAETGPGAWECGDCNRAFQLKFLGLLSRGFAATAAANRPQQPAPGRQEDA
jgi:transposase-like protein